jgi:hypothetical protein
VQPTPQSYRTAEDVEREMAALFLQDDEEENANEEAWMNSFKSQLEGETDPIDEQFEDFQLQLPDGI